MPRSNDDTPIEVNEQTGEITTPAPTGRGFPSLFTSLNDDKETLRVLYYGQPGTGKTTAALAAANAGRVLVINAEGGVKKTALQKQGINVNNVLLWPNAGQKITAKALQDLYLNLQAEFNKDPDFLEAVVIDSVTEVHHLLREQATGERIAQSRREVDPNFVDRADYGVMTNQMRSLVRQFNNLPCHVILIALEKEGEEQGQVRPALTPALAADVMGYMDIVLHTEADYTRPGSLQYYTQASPSGNSLAKDRFGALPAELVDGNFERILGFVTGALDNEDLLQQEQNEYLAEKAEEEARKRAEREERVARLRGEIK